MAHKTAAPGSIWTVPKVGAKALCLVLSPARGVGRGRPEHQVVPLYIPDNLFRIHSAFDFLIKANETTLGVVVYAGLWNLRPILLDDLGELVGEIAGGEVLGDLRDAYLRLADPAIAVRAGRLGQAQLSAFAEQWRAQEISAWQPLSGMVLEPYLRSSTIARLEVVRPWVLTPTDIEFLAENIESSEELVGALRIQAIGDCIAVFSTNVTFSGPVSTSVAEPSLFPSVIINKPWDGRFVAAHVDLSPRNTLTPVRSVADSEKAA